jgi:predicted secreted hydrolase
MKRLLIGLLAAALGAAWALTRTPEAPAPPALSGGAPNTTGFARALTPRELTLPADHGPHFDYQTEWWYYTGNVQSESGEQFGYQLTFFRRGLTPGEPAGLPGLATNQIYFAHFALTDVAGGRHHGVERFSRGSAGLAGASAAPVSAWLEDWRMEALNPEGSVVRLRAREAGAPAFALDLTLRAVKPVVLHGDRGLSQKSEQAGNASYYMSYTRMATEGVIEVDGRTVAVRGESWFDHEWSTSVLGEGTVGWDWFSLQLGDGHELMLYFLRRTDGSVEPVSGGTLVAPDGQARPLTLSEVEVEVLSAWTSPETGARYPARWRVRVPAAELEVEVTPRLNAQEMLFNTVYWEGAVSVQGARAGTPVTGQGYVELTGYSGSLQDELGAAP